MIDSNNTLVQKVIQAGYSEERSIEAVKFTRMKDCASALQYLQEQEDIDEDEVILLDTPQFCRFNSNDLHFKDTNR